MEKTQQEQMTHTLGIKNRQQKLLVRGRATKYNKD